MSRRILFLALALAGAAAYHNSFQGAFVFDDFRHIAENPVLHDLSRPGLIFSGTTRPVALWTFALNYAAGGLHVWGYHAVNLGIHLAAGLVLFALLAKHLRTGPAFFSALLWLVHPLQTQAVNYIVQRSELLMGFFYLLTLYFLRGCAEDPSRRRKTFCLLSCALGMASKPIMVTAPLMALLYDRIFLSPSWKELWRRRGRLHAGLFATIGILILCLLNGPGDYATDVGFHLPDIPPGAFLLEQGKVLLHYLRLVFWPEPLVFDYGWRARGGADGSAAWGILLLFMAGLGWAGRKRPALGFLGVWFFLILAPTSLIPISDLAFEHRMYLPLAAPAVGVVLAVEALRVARPLRYGLLAALVLALGMKTVQRNTDYRSAVALWKDTVSKRPEHARAHGNLGAALHLEGKLQEALSEYQTSLRLDPDQPDVYSNLGHLLENLGRPAEARLQFEEALHRNPIHPKASANLGKLLYREGMELTRQERWEEAEKKLLMASLWKDDAELWNNLGTLYDRQKEPGQALLCYQKALERDPDSPSVLRNIQAFLRRKISSSP